MAEPVVLAEVISVRGHPIRLTLQQWLHISENHDYMAGNRSLVLEIIADPDKLLVGEASETLALRAYTQTRCLFHKYTASRHVGATLVVARCWAGTRPAPTGTELTKWTSSLTAKTAVVIYRDEPDGFIITTWLTSRADRVRAKGVQTWRRLPSISD